ncbi:gamma-glutamyl-gamma-aminobutyrate hydrolase family protein [Gordonia sp. C13]|uniref:gamma-glutamyl-gamma-aminobutyrate hydrolase family protein n=1 Tax=Gordonia sp. C13 TaxID=2935078 RepID=UPI00200A13FC|nr:gamma-glutamyl-gamma-aminobutyrate hydrolase family protein [Gordonia sp. C13]MCK8613966.1 gamma-glutamyl-gamma-aminobutyrate hydrolase family protein [Gordonia sp. C13]
MNERPVIAVTYNLEELHVLVHWRQMFRGIVEAGATPMAIDTGSHLIDTETLIANVDGLIISGGGDISPHLYGGLVDDPTLWGVNDVRDANEINMLASAQRVGRPVLAICRGLHLVNATMGGTIWQDLDRDHPTNVSHRLGEHALLQAAHPVALDPDSAVARWTSTTAITVNSQHHQGIRTLAPRLRATARSQDGIVEGFENQDGSLVGIQWHPEIFWPNDTHSLNVLSGFASDCAAAIIPRRTAASGTM